MCVEFTLVSSDAQVANGKKRLIDATATRCTLFHYLTIFNFIASDLCCSIFGPTIGGVIDYDPCCKKVSHWLSASSGIRN